MRHLVLPPPHTPLFLEVSVQMKRFAFTLLVSFLLANSVLAQVVISTPTAEDAGRAMGFYLAQSATLKNLVQLHPDLKNEALLAEVSFEAKFGRTINNIDARMGNVLKDKWDHIK